MSIATATTMGSAPGMLLGIVFASPERFVRLRASQRCRRSESTLHGGLCRWGKLTPVEACRCCRRASMPKRPGRRHGRQRRRGVAGLKRGVRRGADASYRAFNQDDFPWSASLSCSTKCFSIAEITIPLKASSTPLDTSANNEVRRVVIDHLVFNRPPVLQGRSPCHGRCE